MRLVNTCYACPAQWEGLTDDGEHVYCRYRWGVLSIEINGEEVLYDDSRGDAFDGMMTSEELRPVLASLGYHNVTIVNPPLL